MNQPTIFVDPSGLRWCGVACGALERAEGAVVAIGEFTERTRADFVLGVGVAACGVATIATSGAAAVCIPIAVGAFTTGLSRSAVQHGIVGDGDVNYCRFASSAVTSLSVIGVTRLVNAKLWQGAAGPDRPFVVEADDRAVLVGSTDFLGTLTENIVDHLAAGACSSPSVGSNSK
jgi:hypothetical protein